MTERELTALERQLCEALSILCYWGKQFSLPTEDYLIVRAALEAARAAGLDKPLDSPPADGA